MKKLMFLFMLVIFLGITSLAAVMVEPGRFILQIEPGKKETGAITVINIGDADAKLEAVLYDWDIGEDGKLNETTAGSRTDTLNGLIKFNPRQFTIKPGQSQVVRFTIDAPTDNIEHKGIVFFEEVIASGGDVSTLITAKVGATIYAAPKGAKRSIHFNNISVSATKETVDLVVKAINNGNVHLRMVIQYKLQTKSGKVVLEDSFKEQVLLSGKEVAFNLPITTNLASGQYRLILDFSFYGIESSYNQVVEFSIP